MNCTYLVLTPFFPSNNNFRGSYIYDQVKAIKNNSSHIPIVILLTTFFSNEQKKYNYKGISCLSFKVWDFPSFFFPGLFHRINSWRLNKFLSNNKIFLSENTIIHSHVAYPAAYFASYLGERYYSKTLAQHHGLDVFQLFTGRIAKGFLKILQNKYLKKRTVNVLAKMSYNIGVSQKVLDELHYKTNLSKNKSFVLYNGVDFKKFYYDSKIKKNSDYYIIGCVANFWKTKDQISLLKSCKILQEKGILNIKIIFIGSGQELIYCQDFAKKNALNCEFKKEVDHTKLNLFYNQLDLFVLPSYNEAFGCVYAESWAAEIPFIAVKGQGIEEIMTKKMRIKQLVSRESPKELANKIYYFYHNKQRLINNSKLDIQLRIKKFLNQIQT